jgi:hypothetical protein
MNFRRMVDGRDGHDIAGCIKRIESCQIISEAGPGDAPLGNVERKSLNRTRDADSDRVHREGLKISAILQSKKDADSTKE